MGWVFQRGVNEATKDDKCLISSHLSKIHDQQNNQLTDFAAFAVGIFGTDSDMRESKLEAQRVSCKRSVHDDDARQRQITKTAIHDVVATLTTSHKSTHSIPTTTLFNHTHCSHR